MKKNAVLTSLLLIFFIPVLLFAQMPGGIGGAINAPKTQKTETIHWRNITNKPNTFPPAPHTHPGGTHDHANLTILDDISAPYTSAEQSKLSGIAAGAEVNVNADWNSGSGDSQILNKPTLGDAATKNVGTGAGDVSAGNHGHTQLHTQGTDQALDTGGENEISAANAKAAYTHSGVAHAPSDAVSLATVKADADVASAISLKHTAGTDQGLDTGGVNAVTAAQAKTAYSHSQAAHAPSDAQKNSDISKAEIEAKLTGEISSHSHAGGGGGDNFTIQTVTGDVVNNNASANTLANVTGLTFAVTSGKTYKFKAHCLYTSAASTTGSRWTVNGPAMTYLAYTSEYTLTVTTTTRNAVLTAVQLPAASNATSNTSNGGGNMAIIEGMFRPSAGGTFAIQFASEVSNSAITAKIGSHLEWRQMD